MITLKLSAYSEKEVKKLATLLDQLQPILHENCIKHTDCKTCEYRHLCIDITQATIYAEEYR